MRMIMAVAILVGIGFALGWITATIWPQGRKRQHGLHFKFRSKDGEP